MRLEFSAEVRVGEIQIIKFSAEVRVGGIQIIKFHYLCVAASKEVSKNTCQDRHKPL
jgi:hypothetical protein